MSVVSFSFWALIMAVTLAVTVNGSPPFQLGELSGPTDFTDGTGTKQGPGSVRLPRNVYPLHYDLEIRPILTPDLDPNQFTAPGKVTIRLRCDVPTNSITLHSDDIDIDDAAVTLSSVEPHVSIPITGHLNDTSISTYTIQLANSLVVGMEYDLFIPFVAKVGTNRLSGLYRSSYQDATGNTVWLATTQFQKLGARQAFPCFDEPNFRSTFNVTIGRSAEHNSLCNSPLKETIPIDGMPNWSWDVYEKTVSMPTYLVAMIVSDLVSVTAPEELSNYLVKTWGPPTMTDNATAEFSARAAAQILTFFENYFDSPYQFPKLDSVAVPDFEAGAMENWALNTYRIVLMLWFDGESTQFEQWRQSAVIAHEISHHWFGDLVTCDWWNDIWLNEGFARYTQFIGANASLTQHGIMDRYTLDVIQPAMDFDAGPNTEPVRSNVTDQVTNQPSRIIYEKAAGLLRMMQGFLTEDTLIKALRVYLDKYAYGNTVQDQLFAELQTQAEIDGTAPQYSVKEIMDTWTLKSGFPLITLRKAGTNAIFISQEPFSPLAQREGKEPLAELWYIPVTYATKANPDFSSANFLPKFWIDKNTLSTAKFIQDNTEEWIIVNPDARSFYRVIYDDHFFNLILNQLEEDHTVISLSSRSQLFDDYFKSVFAGYVEIEDAFDLTKYLQREKENTVWTTVLNNLRQTSRFLQGHVAHDKFKAYILSKVSPVLDVIGWEQNAGDVPVQVILRSQLLDWACAYGDPKCDEITTKYIDGLVGGQGIPADIQPMIYCKAVSKADNFTTIDLNQHVLDGYKNAWRVERHNLFINSMACIDPLKVQDVEGLLDTIISNTSDFTPAHGRQVMQRLVENPANRETVMTYFRINFMQIFLTLEERAVSDVVSAMAAYTSDATGVNEIKSFITTMSALVNSEAVKTSLEASRAALDRNIVWAQTYAARIDSWLTNAIY